MITQEQMFINQCKALIKTLNKYKVTEGASFGMNNWITTEHVVDDVLKNDDTLDFECGTVCCICGWQAVSEELDDFPRASLVKKDVMLYVEDVDSVAIEVGHDLQDYNYHLAASIYYAEEGDRLYNAERSKFFTQDELEHPHLTTASSFEDAIDYLELIVRKLESNK